MHAVTDRFERLLAFLHDGGPVLWAIGIVAMLLAALIIERRLYLHLVYPGAARVSVSRWRRRTDRTSRQAHHVRNTLVSDASLRLRRPLPLVKGLVGLCPLLGLLGTVTGMIEVFDVMAALGTGNVRAMAGGISRAIIPTMAGMVVALPGLYFSLQLENAMERAIAGLRDRLGPAPAT